EARAGVRGAADETNAMLLVGDATAADPRYPPLKFAGEELTKISGHFPNAKVTTLVGAHATADAFLEASRDKYSVIHFAAHASAKSDTPLDSSIVLSPGRDGFRLYARQVADGKVDADLITISACRSAGARQYAGEGLIGLAWAFLHAGAHRVIAGLWDVDDRSTVDLMDSLYARLAGGDSPATALRAAKLAMAHRPDNYRKPYYWAPFQLFTLD